MVEKREKYKRELTTAREAVFRKELEVLEDTSGRISTEDVQWARSCCVKNFTEYEELQTLDLRCPARPKIYKKRGRKPKRTARNLMNGFVQTSPVNQSDGITSEHSGECEESDSVNHHEDSTFCFSDSVNDHLSDQETTARILDVPSTSSCDNNASSSTEGKTLALRNNTIARSTCSNNDGTSSDSDFEDERARKAKRRAAINRLRERKSSKSDTEMVEVSRSGDAMSSFRTSPIHGSNSSNMNPPVNSSEDEEDAKNHPRLSPNTVTSRQRKRNRKRSLCEVSEKRNESQSPRTLRSNSTTALDQQQLTCDVVSEKRVCRANGMLHSSSSSFKNGEGQPEENGELQVRFTRSRSHASDADSSEASGKLHVLFTRSRSHTFDVDSSEENVRLEIPLTTSRSRITSNSGSSEDNVKFQAPLTRSQSHTSDSDFPVENSKVEVRLTRSRSHTSHAESSVKTGKLEVPLTRSRRHTSDAVFPEENDKLESVRFTRSRSRTSDSDSSKSPFEQNAVSQTVDKHSEKEGNIPEFCQTRSHSRRAPCPSTPSMINGVSSMKSEDGIITSAAQLSHDSFSNHDVSDVSSRTRSRSSTLESGPSSLAKSVGISHFLNTSKNSETNCKRDSEEKEVTLRREAKLSDNLGASKATLYSPTKCSNFFSKLRHGATTSA